MALVDGFADKTFIIGSLISLKRIAIGYGLSVLLGTMLGVALFKFRILRDTVGAMVLGLQTLPSICWLPLALLWFGLNEKAIIFVVIMGALLSVTMATESGLRGVPPLYLNAGRNMGLRRFRLFWEVMLPASLPTIIMGLKQGWSFAWRSLMAGELLFVSLGLGHLLMMGRELNDMNQVVAVMILVVVIGLIVDILFFARIERAVRLRWGLERAK